MFRILLFEFGSAIGIDFDHLQVLLAFLEIVNNSRVILVLVRFLEIQQQLVDDGIAHLKPSLLGFAEKVVVLVLQLLALHLLSVELNFLLVAQVRGTLLLRCFLQGGRHVLRLIVDAIVIFAFIKYLVAGRTTRPMLLIYS